MDHRIRLDDTARADSSQDNGVHEVLADLGYQRLLIVNVVFGGLPGARDGEWVLIDAGVPGSAGAIRRAAAHRFGEASRPAAIVLTHGHFDHVGALEELVKAWDVPVYAHELELPYLDGSAAYPPPDPSVGGGIMSAMAGLYPRGPVDVSDRLRSLPPDGSIPVMHGWHWIHTPGHTPGHVSFWRPADRALIAGDAFITTRQESAYAVALQKPEMHGPPMYYTQDWTDARRSVERLAALEPEFAVCGHGHAMRGPEMRQALHALARDFASVAVPEKGRYVSEPARPETGSAYAPPKGEPPK
jgi:glyoxylase-like metal-dependent hydrolase (beta-lactamase superfamily II)